MAFQLVSDYQPEGDQAQAIGKLAKSLAAGNRHQTLLGVTGSGKTFTMANLIALHGKPTLIMSHNKTLAAQLYSEFRSLGVMHLWPGVARGLREPDGARVDRPESWTSRTLPSTPDRVV